ncbi:15617_t:CDS:2, partial [Entrophospora sp. SA101]
TMLSKRHYTDNPDVDVVSEIMRAAHCNQEEWEWFCKVYPTEAARGNIILTAYQYFPYWKQSISCYNYYDLRNLSIDELISSWNELTVNANKKAAKVNELEEKVQALKVELEKSDDRIEELEERVDIEVEMNLKALD